MSKKWIEIKASGPAKGKDDVVDIVVAAGSQGVFEEEESGRPLVKAYLLPEKKAEIDKIEKACARFNWSLTVTDYNDSGWTKKWKKFIKPVKVGTVFVAPTWTARIPKSVRHIIKIDPGMAFGTGTHPTTKNCIRAIYDISLKRSKAALGKTKLLDVGTGSGVLALVAIRLGFGSVAGIDNDPIAVKVAKENAELNGLKVKFSATSLGRVTGRYDVVVANILAETLKRIKKPLCVKVKKEGLLVLSGILNEEAASVVAAYVKEGFSLKKKYVTKEWSTLLLEKAGKK
ncbi:MAG: 50S ribosomal protein L11 methyltransferase [Deltaproteobacteria bacterium]|nr:50S ribosomal protein L11 methyltransferase [Deltaproteobacteria bacterium]